MPSDWQCSCGSGLAKRELRDARGIFCCFVCERCEARKRDSFDPRIFRELYQADEPIEEY